MGSPASCITKRRYLVLEWAAHKQAEGTEEAGGWSANRRIGASIPGLPLLQPARHRPAALRRTSYERLTQGDVSRVCDEQTSGRKHHRRGEKPGEGGGEADKVA